MILTVANLKETMFPKSIIIIAIIFQSTKSSFQQNSLQCGVKNSASRNANFGGNVAKQGTWPWHAALYYKNGPSLEYICGGTLISSQFVLTAANCLVFAQRRYELPLDRIAVRLGINDLNDLSTQQQQDIFGIHKTGNSKNDIAVLELYLAARLNNYVQPACLGIHKNLTGLRGTAIGWGMAANEFLTKVQSVNIPVVSSTSCVANDPNTFRQPLDNRILCVGCSNGNSVCAGDNGGGVFFEIGGAWYLGGIVSSAVQGDAGANQHWSNNYVAFTNIAAHLPWVLETTKLSPAIAQLTPPPDSGDCGPACRNYNCHVDRRCDANVAQVTAVHHPHRDCKKFYTCKERSNVICEFDCPAGLHFNRNKNVCDWAWAAGCDPSIGGK